MNLQKHFKNWQGIPNDKPTSVKLESSKLDRKPYLKQEDEEDEENLSTTDDSTMDEEEEEEGEEAEITDEEEEEIMASEEEELESPPTQVEKQKSATRRSYTDQEKSASVNQVIRKHRGITEVAKEYGIPYSTLYNWVKKAKPSKDGKEDSVVEEEQERDHTPNVIDKQGSPPPCVAEEKEKGTRRTYTDKEKAQCLYEVINKERKIAQVAKEYEIPYSTLYNWVKLAKESPAKSQEKVIRRSYTAEEKSQCLYEVINKERNVAQAAKEFEIPYSTLYKWVKLAKEPPAKYQEKGTPNVYTIEERVECINEVVNNNQTVSAVAREYNIPRSTVDSWVKKSKEGKEGYQASPVQEKEKEANIPSVSDKQKSIPQVKDPVEVEQGKKTRRSYSNEKKARYTNEAIQKNKTVSAVAREFEIPRSTLDSWVKKAKEAKEGYEVSHVPHEKEVVAPAIVHKQKSISQAHAPAEVEKEKKTRRSYSAEEKTRCVSEVINHSKTVSAVARELDIPRSTLDSWVKKARA